MLNDFPSEALRLFTSWANCSAADRAGGTLAMSVMGNSADAYSQSMLRIHDISTCMMRLLILLV